MNFTDVLLIILILTVVWNTYTIIINLRLIRIGVEKIRENGYRRSKMILNSKYGKMVHDEAGKVYADTDSVKRGE
ncbi:MAG: hypothetical protein J6T10_29925 [Methanobrevibacter sp.]|nr:hypothetical protein [Methanobrevibacter sp.]